MIEIRKEEPQDRDAVHLLNLAAFDNGPEATLVDKLRSIATGQKVYQFHRNGTLPIFE